MKKKPILVVMVGYPGSGKTYFSEKLAKKNGFVHLNSDKVRSELFKVPTFSKKEHALVFGSIDEQLKSFLSKGVSVIIDANSPRRSQRKALRDLATQYGAHCITVHVRTPFPVTRDRVRARKDIRSTAKRAYNRVVTLKVHKYLKDLLEEPKLPEQFLTIDGRKSFREQYSQFEQAIEMMK